ncbi:uncharacterized protein LOC132175844 [Corylus avellana]|uniref:uncharacterized protein LOC132175844 n=1 Tax=Corylus avellana TaxID=13451 RepID=UPI00286C1A15|nr:uncharacterized protein LOC132175844 [Corylus avellana]
MLKHRGSSFESSQPSFHCKCATFFTRNEGSVATQRKVRLSKRKVLIAKRIVEQAKKKQRNKFLAKQKRRKNQACESIEEEGMNTSEVPLNSTTCIHHGREIGTEDSVMAQGSQEITKLIAAGTEKLALAPDGGGTFDCATSFNLFN